MLAVPLMTVEIAGWAAGEFVSGGNDRWHVAVDKPIQSIAYLWMFNIDFAISAPSVDEGCELVSTRQSEPHWRHVQYRDAVALCQWQHRLGRALVEDAVLEHHTVPDFMPIPNCHLGHRVPPGPTSSSP